MRRNQNHPISDNIIIDAFDLSSAAYSHVLESVPNRFIFERELFPSDFQGTEFSYFDNTMRATVHSYSHSSSQSNDLFVSFRGSINHANWIQNIGFLNRELPKSYQAFADQVMQRIFHDYPNRNIIFTGHSSGAAMSIYCSLKSGKVSVGFDCPDFTASGVDLANWAKVALVQAGSIISGKKFDQIMNIGRMIKLDHTTQLTDHLMGKIGSRLQNQLGNLGRLVNSMGIHKDFLGELNRDIASRVNQLVSHFCNQARQDNFDDMITKARTMYQGISAIGQQIQSQSLQRIATIGQKLVQLHQSLTRFGFNMSALGAFAQISSFLNPITAMVGSGMALFSALGFGRKQRNNQNNAVDFAPVLQAIRELHQEMRESFQQVFQNQYQIMMAVQQLGVMAQHNFTILGRKLDRILDRQEDIIQRLDTVMTLQNKQYLSSQQADVKKLRDKIEQKLQYNQHTTTDIALLQLLAQNFDKAKDPLLMDFHGEPQGNYGWFYLAQLEGLFSQKGFTHYIFDRKKYPNLLLWQQVMDLYFQTSNYLFKTEDPNIAKKHDEILGDIRSSGTVVLDLLEMLSSEDFLKAFLAHYCTQIQACAAVGNDLLKMIAENYSETAVKNLVADNIALNKNSPDLAMLADTLKERTALTKLEEIKAQLEVQIKQYNAIVKRFKHETAIIKSILGLNLQPNNNQSIYVKKLLNDVMQLPSIPLDTYQGLKTTEIEVKDDQLKNLKLTVVKGDISSKFIEVNVPVQTLTDLGNSAKEAVKDTISYLKQIVQFSVIYQSILNQQYGFNTDMRELNMNVLQETFSALRPIFEIAQHAANKNVALVVGGTGDGKSTLLNYLYGCDYELTLDSSRGLKQSKLKQNSKSEICQVGHSIAKSETLYPQLINMPNTSVVYCDMPGFFDNRGDIKRICAAMAPVILSKKVNGIKSLVWIIDNNTIVFSRAMILKNSLKYFIKIAQNNPRQLASSLVIAITKPSEGLTKEGIIRNFYAIAEDITDDRNQQDLFLELIDSINQNQQQLVICDVFEPTQRNILKTIVDQVPVRSATEFDFLSYSPSQAEFKKLLLAMAEKFIDYTTKIRSQKRQYYVQLNDLNEEYQKLERLVKRVEKTDKNSIEKCSEKFSLQHVTKTKVIRGSFCTFDDCSSTKERYYTGEGETYRRQGHQVWKEHMYGNTYKAWHQYNQPLNLKVLLPLVMPANCRLTPKLIEHKQVKVNENATPLKSGYTAKIEYPLGETFEFSMEFTFNKAKLDPTQEINLKTKLEKMHDLTLQISEANTEIKMLNESMLQTIQYYSNDFRLLVELANLVGIGQHEKINALREELNNQPNTSHSFTHDSTSEIPKGKKSNNKNPNENPFFPPDNREPSDHPVLVNFRDFLSRVHDLTGNNIELPNNLNISHQDLVDCANTFNDEYTNAMLDMLMVQMQMISAQNVKKYQAISDQQLNQLKDQLINQQARYAFIPVNLSYNNGATDADHWVALVVDRTGRSIWFLDPAKKMYTNEIQSLSNALGGYQLIENRINFQENEQQEGWVRHCGMYVFEIFQIISLALKSNKSIIANPNANLNNNDISLNTLLNQVQLKLLALENGVQTTRIQHIQLVTSYLASQLNITDTQSNPNAQAPQQPGNVPPKPAPNNTANSSRFNYASSPGGYNAKPKNDRGYTRQGKRIVGSGIGDRVKMFNQMGGQENGGQYTKPKNR